MKIVYRFLCGVLFASTLILTLLSFSACGGKNVESLEIVENPYKLTYYAGEYFDIAGLIILAKYSDGSQESLKFSDNNISNKLGYVYDKYKVPLKASDRAVTFTFSKCTAQVNIFVKKRDVLPPNADEIKYVATSRSITITSLKGAEYRLGYNKEWSDDNRFNGLHLNSEYDIYIRYKETEFFNASSIIKMSIKTTKGSQGEIEFADFVVATTCDTITINKIVGAEYSIDNGATWSDNNVFCGLTPGKNYVVQIRRKETNQFFASNSLIQNVTLPKMQQDKPQNVVATHITQNNIVLTKLENAEYKLEENGNWQSSNVFQNLKADTKYMIFVRYKETSTKLHSDEVILIVSTIAN